MTGTTPQGVPRQDTRRLMAALYELVPSSDLALVYQPVVESRTGRPIGAEALLRWQHPDLARVPCKVLIPLAEATERISDIGRWVLQQATEDAASWAGDDSHAPSLSVNVSATQLARFDFADEVLAALGGSGLDAGRLVLEITENESLGDPSSTRATVKRLALNGVRFALDDFGTGHANLHWLSALPIDIIKIDKTFVAGLGRREVDATIVRFIVDLARSQGASITAEGVETEEQRRRVVELGCEHGQGWHFFPPMGASEVRGLFESAAVPRVRSWSPHPARLG